MDYRVGDVIVYRSFGGRRTVRVTNREADIKNGRPGFDGDLISEDGAPADRLVRFGLGSEPVALGCWGYDEQIIDVIWKEHT